MTFDQAIDAFLADWHAEGRLRSRNSIVAYRRVLNRHAEDVGNRDPAKTGKTDVKRTLGHWQGNSRRQAHSILNTFYGWCEQEDIRQTNPARQVRATRAVKPSVFRPTRDEVVRLLDASSASRNLREKWIVHLGVLAGIRRQEFVGLQPRHFARDGFVWVSEDIGKGGKERWIPVLPELAPVVDEIRMSITQPHYYVLGRSINVSFRNDAQAIRDDQPMHPTSVHKLVRRVGRRAGMPVDIGTHTLRHAFGTHVARYAGLRAAQALMGHESVETTAGTYTEAVSLDELAVSVQGFAYRQAQERLPLAQESRP